VLSSKEARRRGTIETHFLGGVSTKTPEGKTMWQEITTRDPRFEVIEERGKKSTTWTKTNLAQFNSQRRLPGGGRESVHLRSEPKSLRRGFGDGKPRPKGKANKKRQKTYWRRTGMLRRSGCGGERLVVPKNYTETKTTKE